MVYYEMLMLLAPDVTNAVSDSIKNEISESITKNDGVVHNYDKWGKYLLAYKIKKHPYGIYILVRFSSDKKNCDIILKKIRDLCTLKFNNSIMRYVFVKLGKTMTETYCKPDSLEDAPRRDKAYDVEEMINKKKSYPRRNNEREERTFDGAVLDNSHEFETVKKENNEEYIEQI